MRTWLATTVVVMAEAGQGELDLWPRTHDLPPRWDGLPVQWGAWSSTGEVFMCPPRRVRSESCDRCGSTDARMINVGRVWTDPDTAPPAIGRARLRRGRHPVGVLSAFRCPGCGHDSVLDPNGQLWDLDDTDYTDDGSWNVNTCGAGDSGKARGGRGHGR